MTDDRRKLMLVCIFISIAGVAGDILINLPFGILTGCGALVFYMAGNMLKTYKPTYAILAIGGYLAGLHFHEFSLHGKQPIRVLPS